MFLIAKTTTTTNNNNHPKHTIQPLPASYEDIFDEPAAEDETTEKDMTNTNDDNDYKDDDDDNDEIIPRINSVTLVGRIGQTPDPKYLDDGKVVLNLSLAVKRKYHPLERRVRDIPYGEEETDWFGLELWGRDAEFASRFITKGARIGVTGTLESDSWVDRITGDERHRYKVLVKHLDVLETRAEAQLRQNSGAGGGGGYTNNNQNNRYYNQDQEEDYGDGPSSAGTGGFFD